MDYANLRLKSQRHTIKSEDESKIDKAMKRGFPYCKGTYPDCPKVPHPTEPMCRTCPIAEDYILQQKYKRRD